MTVNIFNNLQNKIKGTVRTFVKAAPALFYGLIFNYQEDGAFYAARIHTGIAENALQIVRVVPGEGGY